MNAFGEERQRAPAGRPVARAVSAVRASRPGVAAPPHGPARQRPRAAWVAAPRSRPFAAAVSYYGGGVPDLADEQPNCPVQLHFGEQDHAIPLAGVDRLKAGHPELPVYVYPAGHGFNCDQRDSYDAAAAKLARERTLELFRKHVG